MNAHSSIPTSTVERAEADTLRAAARHLRQIKHSSGFGAGMSGDVANLLDAEADTLAEIAAEAADTEAAGELIIITSTTAAALAVARRVLAA